jgi:predicted RNA-binding Zn-ribbon protein involved in translation (DUF1610 family)
MLDRDKWHKSLTNARIMEAARRRMFSLDSPGFCLTCGNEAEGVEPDARRYACEACGEREVYGAEELTLCLDWPMGASSGSALWPAGSSEDGD